jgi:hypothetical protein
MIYGMSLTDESTVVDLKATKSDGTTFAYIRARKVGKDDQKVVQWRAACEGAVIPYGVFFDFDYRGGATAAAQADDFSALTRAADPLPPAVRLWDIVGASRPAWVDYAKLLGEVLYYLENRVHRPVVVFGNVSTISGVLGTLNSLSPDMKDRLLGAQWCPITWSAAAGVPTLPVPLTKFPIWEYTDPKSSLSGVAGVALQKWPGTLEQMLAWGKTTTLDNIPVWGVPPVVVEPPVVVPPPPMPVMTNNFERAAIFSWNAPAVPNFVDQAKAAGVRAVYLKMADGPNIFSPSNTAFPNWGENVKEGLVFDLRAANIAVIGWQFCYGFDPLGEARIAAQQCARFGLTEWIFDAESTFDGQPGAATRATQLFNEFKLLAPNVKTAWCWWARYESPVTGAQWHPIDVIRAAMAQADYGMPMMYWAGESAANALDLFAQSAAQWKKITTKPIIPVGRAYTGDGGTISAAAIPLFAAEVRKTCPGISWWLLDQATAISNAPVMAALKLVGDGWGGVVVPPVVPPVVVPGAYSTTDLALLDALKAWKAS